MARPAASEPVRPARLSLGLFLFSAALIWLQMLQVRAFSFMLWHHLGYLVVTVAMLGMGAAGSWLVVRRRPVADPARTISRLGLLFALSVPLSFGLLSRIPLDTFMAPSFTKYAFVFLYYCLLLPPFLAAGGAVAIALSALPDRIPQLYAANLSGSAAGAALPLLLLGPLSLEANLGACSLLALAGGLVVLTDRTALAGGMAAAALCLTGPSSGLFDIRPAPSKALGMFEAGYPDLRHEFSQWNPVARIDAVRATGTGELYQLLSGPHAVLTIDGDAYTFAYDFPSPPALTPELGRSLYNAAYILHPEPPASVLIVGLGGLADVWTALHNQAAAVTGVELNDSMIRGAALLYSRFRHDLFRRPELRVVHDEGRSFLARDTARYDHIQLSGVDTWAALAAGAYVLSENYIYTVDAFRDYLARLSPEGGTVSLIRWRFDPPREGLRLLTVLVAAARAAGIERPDRQVVVAATRHFVNVIYASRPLTETDCARLERWAGGAPDLSFLYLPCRPDRSEGAYAAFLDADRAGRGQEFIDGYRYDITPVGDDRPFFFNYYRWSDLLRPAPGAGGYLDAFAPTGLITLLAALLQSVMLSLLLIALPVAVLRRRGRPAAGRTAFGLYFALIGSGFMLLEIATMQRFVKILGDPAVSIAVTIAALLTGSAAGSLAGGRLPGRHFAPIGLGAIAAALGLQWLLLASDLLLPLPLAARISFAALSIAACGVGLGLFFPGGLRLAADRDPLLVPWLWAVNACSSVICSVLAVALAMSFGFSAVLWISLACYVAASVALRQATAAPAPPAPRT